MNNLINDFIEYLYNIGILSNDSLGKFTAMNSSRNDNLNIEESFIEQMKKSLVNFIYNLNNEQKFIFTENIVKKFLSRIQNNKIKKLKEIILIMTRVKCYDLKSYLLKWMKKCKKKGIPIAIKRVPVKNNFKITTNKKNIFNKKNFFNKNNNLLINTKSPNNLKRNKTEINIFKNKTENNTNNNNNKKNNFFIIENNTENNKIITENNTRNNQNLLENNIINNNLSKENNSKSNNISTENIFLNNKKQNQNSHEKHNSNHSIKTETSNTNKSIIEFIPIKNKIYFNFKKEKQIYHPLLESFYERQNSLLKRRKEYIQNKSFDKELNLSNSCTFIPELNEISHNLTQSQSYTPIHIRLFNDSKYRILTQNNIQSKENERIKKNANRNLYKVDHYKIEQLYNEWKEKKLFKKNLQRRFDKENGITYKPFVTHDKYFKKINSTFMEREKNYIFDKEENVCNYNKDFKNNQISNLVGYERWKDLNREEIVNGVLERLYLNETESKKLKKRNKVVRKSSFETCSSSYKKKIGSFSSQNYNCN